MERGIRIIRIKEILLLLLIIGIAGKGYSQETGIGVSYGKFYALYKSKDDGTGFRNTPKSQYSGYPSINFNKYFSKKVSGEIIVSFLPYQQYIGTRLYSPNFFSVMHSGNISITVNYAVVKAKKLEGRLKIGLGIGLVPDLYQGNFVEMFFTGISFDSISRGEIRRDFTPIFPTISSGVDVNYNVLKRVKVGIGFTSQIGFIKITEYNIYYNDGSGNNDQHARQWGNGSFYSFYAGIRYILRKKNK